MHHDKQILAPQPCVTCRGTGIVSRPNPRSWWQFTKPATIAEQCSVCTGNGKVPSPIAKAFETQDFSRAVHLAMEFRGIRGAAGENPKRTVFAELAELLGSRREPAAIEALIELLRLHPGIEIINAVRNVPPEYKGVAIKALSPILESRGVQDYQGRTAAEALIALGDVGVLSWMVKKILSSDYRDAGYYQLFEECCVKVRAITVTEILALATHEHPLLAHSAIKALNRRAREDPPEDFSKHPQAVQIADRLVDVLVNERFYFGLNEPIAAFKQLVSERHLPGILAEIERQLKNFCDSEADQGYRPAVQISTLVNAMEEAADETTLPVLLRCTKVDHAAASECAVRVIAGVLARAPQRISEPQLREIANIGAIRWFSSHRNDENGFPIYDSHDVDCSRMRLLASQELSNRGMRAS